MHPGGTAGARATRANLNGMVNPRLRHKPGYLYRRRTLLPPFHRLVQRLTVRDIDQGAATVKGWQRRKVYRLFLCSEQTAERSLYQLRHCSALARRFALQLSHDLVIDLEGSFHMENHIDWMEVCQGGGNSDAFGFWNSRRKSLQPRLPRTLDYRLLLGADFVDEICRGPQVF